VPQRDRLESPSFRDEAAPEIETCAMRGGRWKIVWHALVGLFFVAHGIVTVAIWGPN
jgi:hypothetical protein